MLLTLNAITMFGAQIKSATPVGPNWLPNTGANVNLGCRKALQNLVLSTQTIKGSQFRRVCTVVSSFSRRLVADSLLQIEVLEHNWTTNETQSKKKKKNTGGKTNAR